MEITFNVERPTKNTVKFQEDAPEGIVPKMGTVYVQKSVLKEFGVADPDKAKTVTLEIKSAT